MMALTVFTVIAFTAAGPQEKALGHNIRIVYLHGAWVWTALVVLLAAGLAGLGGLVSRRERLHCWSRVLGRTGMFFWITYLPISLWAMQSNWNGLFLAEPRWRLAFVFAVSGLLLQTGLALAERQALTSAANLGFVATLLIALRSTENVMHPPSPILSSEAVQIQFYFVGLLLLTLFAAWQIARLLIRMEKHCA
jgi:hypothetical protein